VFHLVERITTEELLDPLADRLRAPRTALTLRERVTMPEWVITPSFGMRRWLTTQIAPRLAGQGNTDGIIAHWQQDFPSKLTSRVLNAHLVASTGKPEDPWGIARLQFAIHDWAYANPTHPAASPLLGDDGKPLLSRSRHFADLFDRYFTWRPDFILSWINGATATSKMHQDEVEQMALFLEIHRHIKVPTPTERWSEAWGNVEQFIGALPATDRLTIVGPYSLPGGALYVDAIESLSRFLDVAVFAPSVGDAGVLASTDEPRTEALRLWGDLTRSIAPLVARLHEMNDSPTEVNSPSTPLTVLQSLQTTLITDSATAFEQPDNSIIVHGCYGESRQAEVLRDAILHDLADNAEGFNESDILVVCTDLAKYAPLIRAAFGEPRRASLPRDTDSEPSLAYTIVDPNGSTEGLYLRGLRHFIDLVQGRFRRTDVLSFFEEPTVAKALRFTEESAALHDSWSRSAGIRWGLSASHRTQLGLSDLGDANTWEAGIRRMSLGVLVDNPSLRASGGTLPVEIPPGQFKEFAAFAQGVQHLKTAHERSVAVQPLSEWLAWLDHSRAALFRVTEDEAKEEERVLNALQPLRDASLEQTFPLSFYEFVRVLNDCLDSIGSIGALLTGGITITAPNVLVGVTFQSVYVIGLDENAFVATEADRADLRRDEIRVGDISPSAQARNLFASTVISAKRRLTLLTNAANVLTGKPTDPSIVISEIRDALEGCTEATMWPKRSESKAHLLQPFIVKHPRNPFSVRNFLTTEDSLQAARNRGVFEGAWSYSSINFALANIDQTSSLHDNATPVPRRAAMPTTVTLDELASFVRNPPRTYTQRTLGISLARSDDDEGDELDAQGGGLVQYKAVERLWQHERAQVELREAIHSKNDLRTIQKAGDAPPDPILDSDGIIKQVNEFATHYKNAISGTQASLEYFTTNTPRLEIISHIPVFRVEGKIRLVEVVLSSCRIEKLIGVWLRALLLVATNDESIEIHLIHKTIEEGEGEGTSSIATRVFEVTGRQAISQGALEELANLYIENLNQPLPYWSGEDPDTYNKQSLDEDRWRNEEFIKTSTHYLGDPWWQLCFGHLSAKEIVADNSHLGFKRLLQRFKQLLNMPISLFDFAAQIGGSK